MFRRHTRSSSLYWTVCLLISSSRLLTKNLDVLDDKPKHHVYRLVVGKLIFYFLGDFYHNDVDTNDEVAIRDFFKSYHHDFYRNYRYSYKKVTDEYRIHKILEDCENGGNIIKVPKTL